MKSSIIVALVLTLGLTACSSDEPSAPTAAAKPEPAAKAAAPAGEAITQEKILAASQQAFDAAEKACKGCPNPQACQEALGSALQVTTLALQAFTVPSDSLEQSQKEAEILTKRFDGLAELSNECLNDEG